MLKVEKRDGKIVDFKLEKIEKAISKAFDATQTFSTEDILEKLALRTTAKFNKYIKNDIISVEKIQDCVEYVLIDSDYSNVAKSYILYRKEREKARNIEKTVIDYKDIVNKYVNIEDWRVKENSTVTYSVGGLILHNSGAITANYWLSEIYDEEIANAHKNGDMHIHDLSMLTGYCAGWSLKQLIKEGLGGISGKITSLPASHLSTLCNQMVNFIGIMQNEWAGAQAFSSFDTYLAPFVKKDNLCYKEVKQCIQSFVYGMNTPSRWGCQAPFSNITLDWTVPDDLAELPCIVGGKEQPFKYKDCKKEMDMVNKAFIEIMIEGDANGRGFQYPIPTYSITKDFDWSDTENNRLLFDMTSKYGTPYFSNYVNSDMKPSDVRSMAILGTQNVIYKDQSGEILKNEIRYLVNNWIQADDNNKPKYQILMNGKFIDIIDMFEVPYKNYDKYVSINLANGQKQDFSYQHKCPVIRNGKYLEIESQTLKKGDKFLIAKHPYNESTIGSYISGKILGYYIAKGLINHNNCDIEFAINIDRQDIAKEISDYFSNMGCEIKIQKQPKVHIYKVYIVGKQAIKFVNNFVSGKSTNEKHLCTTIWNTSLDFRKGIYDGYLEINENKQNNIFAYTTNKTLIDDFITLGTTIGKYFKYQAEYSDKETFTSYKLNIIDFDSYNDDYYLIDVENVELPSSKTNVVYNFTVNTKEHLYELPNGIITHQCCRLRLDLRELRKKSGGYFGSGESTGSIGVVTINMPRIAYLSKTPEEFYKRLENIMDIAARSLKIKRNFITKMLNDGLYPYTKRYLGDFNNHFSTIGLIGMNEVGLNACWLGKDLIDKKTQQFTEDVLNFMRNKLSDYQEKYGDLYNLEATPAESTTYRLAKHDKEKYPDIKTAGKKENETPYYTNSSHLPVGYTDDIFNALDIQDKFQVLYTSGTVFHVFLGEKLPDWKATAKLVRVIAYNYKLPYYTIAPTYSVCPKDGYLAGEHFKCPHCNQPAEVYSKITGYYRPIQNWNDGKIQEYKDRKEYVINQKQLISNKNTETNKIENKKNAYNTKEDNKKNILITTKTCPNCKIARNVMEKANINYDEMFAEDNPDFCNDHNIMSVPTLLVPTDNGFKEYTNASNITKYINSL